MPAAQLGVSAPKPELVKCKVARKSPGDKRSLGRRYRAQPMHSPPGTPRGTEQRTSSRPRPAPRMPPGLWLLCSCWLLLLGLPSCAPGAARRELKLLQVLSVNKFYVPEPEQPSPPDSQAFQLPRNLSYEYFARNGLDLPNAAKLDLFELGAALRESYDRFLGPVYEDEATRTRTSEFPASIVAGELVNAGLWPPVGPQIWNPELAWQPIPFEYRPAPEDALLLGTLCPGFQLETERLLSRVALSPGHAELLRYLREAARIRLPGLLEAPALYLALESNVAANRSLPDWARSVFPGGELLSASLAAYELLSRTSAQRRLNGGPLLQALLGSADELRRGPPAGRRKINIYSGDDRTFAGVAGCLDIPLHDVPAHGAALVFELYAEDGDDYSMKIVYKLGPRHEWLPLTLLGCELFCPLEKFRELVAEVLPGDEAGLCRGPATSNSTASSGPDVPGGSAPGGPTLAAALLVLLALTFALA